MPLLFDPRSPITRLFLMTINANSKMACVNFDNVVRFVARGETKLVKATFARITLTAMLTILCAETANAQWLQWGGPSRNFKSPETGLLDKWPPDTARTDPVWDP